MEWAWCEAEAFCAARNCWVIDGLSVNPVILNQRI